MYCSQCGKKVAENMLFCPFCGAPIVIPEQDDVLPAETGEGSAEDRAVQAKSADMPNGEARPADNDFGGNEIPESIDAPENSAGEFVPLDMNAIEVDRGERHSAAARAEASSELSDILNRQLRTELVHLDGHSPDLSGSRRTNSNSTRHNSRKAADTFVPLKKFDSDDIFLDGGDSDDYDDYDDYEEDYDEHDDGRFLMRHIRSLVTLALCAVVIAVVMGWAFSTGGQHSLARAGLAWTPSAYADLAYTAYQSGSYTIAANYYSQALNRDANNYNYANSAGIAYYMAKNLTQAEQMARLAIGINPSRTEAYQLLLRLYPEASTRPEEVLAILRSGYQLTGDPTLNVQ